MKRLLLIIALAVTTALNAQESPLVFHNHWEYISFQLAHPERIPNALDATLRWQSAYTQKLDSVIGADNFDWTRWKNCYDYQEAGKVRAETHFEWENNAWIPVLKTVVTLSQEGETTESMDYARWNGDAWEPYYRVNYTYTSINGQPLVESMTAESFKDTLWVGASRSVYEYDENGNVTFNLNYNGQNNNGEWVESSKNEYLYNEGRLVRRLYSTIRNGNWRESQKDTLSYNDNNLCVSLLTQRKGNGGPGGNLWRDASRYDFNYVDGQLESETLYLGGWFNTAMTLDSRMNYEFDANGNVVRKTASIFNEVDWIVRDVYDNRFDASVEASNIIGLAPVWESTVAQGMGFALSGSMPLNSKWLSCTIASEQLDTEFTLYYSDYNSVDETPNQGMRVYGQNGRLTVETESASDIVVYDLMGRKVAARPQTMRCEFQLTPGLYIVGNGNAFVKTVVH